MTTPPLDSPRSRQATAGHAGGARSGGTAGVSVIGRLEGPEAPPESGAPMPAAPYGSYPEPPSTAGSAATAAIPASGEIEPLNLARRPFVNTRPVVRLAAILWLLGLVLLATNLALFNGYLSDSQETRSKLAGLQHDTERENGNVGKLASSIGTLNLVQENREVAFLNRMIDERTFSWSSLFDSMAEVLPDQVRLLRLTPTNVIQKDVEAALRAGREPQPQPVVLSMSCEAKDDEALLRFVDNLFAHPAFSEPNLASEAREDSGLVKFELSVLYLPDAVRREVAGTTAAPHPAKKAAKTGSRATAAARPARPPGARGAGDEPTPDTSGQADRPSSPAASGLVRVAPLGARQARRGASRPAPRHSATAPGHTGTGGGGR